MEHTYQLTGMTCSSCEAKVKKSIESVAGVVSAEVSKDKQSANIRMEKHIPVTIFQNVLEAKYQISNEVVESEEIKRSWLETYTPILLIFFYITLVTILVQLKNDSFDVMVWMRHFMAGFFLVFSFFFGFRKHWSAAAERRARTLRRLPNRNFPSRERACLTHRNRRARGGVACGCVQVCWDRVGLGTENRAHVGAARWTVENGVVLRGATSDPVDEYSKQTETANTMPNFCARAVG